MSPEKTEALLLTDRSGCGENLARLMPNIGGLREAKISLMLKSERFWSLIESFVICVMRTRKFNGRRERNHGEGQ